MNALAVRDALTAALEDATPIDQASVSDRFVSGMRGEASVAERVFLLIDTETPAPSNLKYQSTYTIGFDLAVFYSADEDSTRRRLRDYRTILVAFFTPAVKAAFPDIHEVEVSSAGVTNAGERTVVARWRLRVLYNPQE
ncbi:MAG: hypothetical protein AMXMBFR77_28010 [Phycisphaerales bacterium]